MTTKLITVLKMCDVYAQPFTLNVSGYKKYKTSIGGFFSILTAILLIFFTIIFAKDMINHTNPKLVSYNKHIEKKQMPLISNQNFTVPLKLIYSKPQKDKNGQNMTYVDIFNNDIITVKAIIQTRGIQTGTVTTNDIVPLSKCRNDHINTFYNLTDENTNLIKNEYFCLDIFKPLDIYGSPFSSLDLKYMRLLFYANTTKLNEQYGKNKTSKSLTKDEMDYLGLAVMAPSVGLFPLTFQGFVQSYSYDTENHEQPIKKIMGLSEFQVTLLDQTRLLSSYKLGRSISDNDILFKNDSEEVSFFKLLDVKTIILSRNPIQADGLLNFFQVMIYIEDSIDIYIRSYIKIQEVIANTLSFGRIIMIILNLVNYFYNQDRINDHLSYIFFKRNPETSYSTDLIYNNISNKTSAEEIPSSIKNDTVLNLFKTLPKYFLTANSSRNLVYKGKLSKKTIRIRSENIKSMDDFERIPKSSNYNTAELSNNNNIKSFSNQKNNIITSNFNSCYNNELKNMNKQNLDIIEEQKEHKVNFKFNDTFLENDDQSKAKLSINKYKHKTNMIKSSLKANTKSVHNFAHSYKNRDSFEFNYDKVEELNEISKVVNFSNERLTFWEKMKGWIFNDKNLDKNTLHKIKFFEKSRLKINNRIDIVYILNKLDELECMKLLLLNPFQTLSLKYLKKPNISFINMNNPRDLYEKFISDPDEEKSKNNLIQYYKEKLEIKSVDEMDLRILELIEPELKKTILMSVVKK